MWLLFLLLYSSYSATTYVGMDGNRFETLLTSINDSIFYNFHNINSDIGGAIYINKPMSIIKFNNLGFIDCSTTNECGAFYIWGQSVLFNNICGYQCESINNAFQFFNVNCENIEEKTITMLAVTSCGSNNLGFTTVGFSGRATYRISNINSSHNYNHFNDISYGACIRSINAYDFHVFNFNFVGSTGTDIINTHFSQQIPVQASHFMNGNIINCTASSIIKFRGTNYMATVYFGGLVYKNKSFETAVAGVNTFLLDLTNCFFDAIPSDINDDSHIKLTNCVQQDPLIPMQINQNDFKLCAIPVFNTMEFTDSCKFTQSSELTSSMKFSPSSEFTSTKPFSSSSKFTSSKPFSPSSKFTSSKPFSPSSEFTSSKPFSPSSKFTFSKPFSPSFAFSMAIQSSQTSEFTYSKSFSQYLLSTVSIQFSPSFDFSSSNSFSNSNFLNKPSGTFTASSPFTPSFTFSPPATKYPDGYQRAQVEGRNKEKQATTVQIGVTAGTSFTIMIVAVVLMLLYLRNKRKQMKEQSFEFSDSLLDDGLQTEDSSYSYSYYTYEEYYSYVKETSEYSEYNEFYEYSDFETSEAQKSIF